MKNESTQLIGMRKHFNLLASLIIIISLSILHTVSFAQTARTVSGRVVDASNNGIIGVTITIKGIAKGVVSGTNGQFRIPVSAKDKALVFSFIGYITKEISIEGKNSINVKLEEEISSIDQVVVVGYGVQKKESTVASISQIDGESLAKVSSSSVSNALTGKIPGLTTVTNSGQPGADEAKIFIRGVSSWMGNDPLVIVDGVERKFNDIDANEIATISVLKDASATAVFGVRGANGVIMITTKRGTSSGVKVNWSAEVTMKQPINLIKQEDSYITGLLVNEAYKNDNNWGQMLSEEVLEHYRLQDLPYQYPNTKWQDMLLKKSAFSQRYNASVSGGTEFAKIFASLSYMNEGDVIKTHKNSTYNPEYSYDRYNYRVNVDMNVTKTTTLALDAGGYIGIRNSPYETNLQRTYRPLYMLGPMDIPMYYEEDALAQYPDYMRPDESGRRLASTGAVNSENPEVAINNSGYKQKKTTNLNITLRLAQKLDFIVKGLKIKASISYDNTSAYLKEYPYDAISYRLASDLSWERYKGRNGNIDKEEPETPIIAKGEGMDNYFRRWYYETSVEYANQFGRHEVTGLFLAQRRKSQTKVAFPTYDEGLVGRVTYSYAKRYLFEFNIGYNGSEQFAPENRYGLFPSYAAGWNIHNENFFRPLQKYINRAKIKYSYGEVGSDASDSRWLYTSSYLNLNGGFPAHYFPGTNSTTGTKLLPITEEKLANRNATWERAVKQDFGIELGMFGNKLTATANFFREDRTQILLDRKSVPAWLGVGLKQQNLGATKTKGYEIEVKWSQNINDKMAYWLSPSISFSDNRIVNRDEPMYKDEYRKEAGHRIFQNFGYLSHGLIQNADDQMNSVRYGGSIMGIGDVQWMDINGDGSIDDNDVSAIGYASQYPLYNYSFNGGFRYKNWELDFMFQAVSHVSRVTIDAFAWPLHRLSNHSFAYQHDAWSPDNRNARYPAYHFDKERTHNNLSDGAARNGYNFYDASYLRLKNVNITYTLSESVCKKIGIAKCSFSLRGNNLFTWAPDYPLSDPEASDGGDRLVYGNYPMMRRITLGAQITF